MASLKKVINFIFLIFLALLGAISSNVFAETVQLKSGKVIEGKIIEEKNDYIKVDVGVENPITLFKDEIVLKDTAQTVSNEDKDVISEIGYKILFLNNEDEAGVSIQEYPDKVLLRQYLISKQKPEKNYDNRAELPKENIWSEIEKEMDVFSLKTQTVYSPESGKIEFYFKKEDKMNRYSEYFRKSADLPKEDKFIFEFLTLAAVTKFPPKH